MHPIMFGGLTVAAIAFPIYGHRKLIGVWLMSLVEKIDRWAESSNKKKGKS